MNPTLLSDTQYLRCLDAMHTWAIRNELPVEIVLCPEEGLGVQVKASDSEGPFWTFIAPKNKSKVREDGADRGETDDEHVDRMVKRASDEFRKTREARAKRLRGEMRRAA